MVGFGGGDTMLRLHCMKKIFSILKQVRLGYDIFCYPHINHLLYHIKLYCIVYLLCYNSKMKTNHL